MEKNPELKKITTFIFLLAWRSGTVRGAMHGAMDHCANGRLGCRTRHSSHTAGQGHGAQGQGAGQENNTHLGTYQLALLLGHMQSVNKYFLTLSPYVTMWIPPMQGKETKLWIFSLLSVDYVYNI